MLLLFTDLSICAPSLGVYIGVGEIDAKLLRADLSVMPSLSMRVGVGEVDAKLLRAEDLRRTSFLDDDALKYESFFGDDEEAPTV